jgi:hypothetical protein
LCKLLFHRRFWLSTLFALALAFLFRSHILRAIAFPLIRSDAAVDAQDLLFLRSAKGCDDAYDFAADFARQTPRRHILILRDYVRRAEAIGAEAGFVETTISMLREHGVPSDRILVMGHGKAITASETLTEAANWLSSQSDAHRLLVVTHRFNTGYLMDVAHASIDQQLRSRMHILGFPKQEIDENNWWQGVRGVKSMIQDQLRLVHLWIFGERRPKLAWDPDQYERSLLKTDHRGQ